MRWYNTAVSSIAGATFVTLHDHPYPGPHTLVDELCRSMSVNERAHQGARDTNLGEEAGMPWWSCN